MKLNLVCLSVLVFCVLHVHAMHKQDELGRVEDFADKYQLEQKYFFDTRQVTENTEEVKYWRKKGYYPTIWSETNIQSCLFDTTSRYVELGIKKYLNMATGLESDPGKNIIVHFNFLIDTQSQAFDYNSFSQDSTPQKQACERIPSLFSTNTIIFSADRQMAIGCCSHALALQDIVSIYRDGNEPKLKKMARLGIFYWLRGGGGVKAFAVSDDNQKIALVRGANVELYTLKKYLEKLGKK